MTNTRTVQQPDQAAQAAAAQTEQALRDQIRDNVRAAIDGATEAAMQPGAPVRDGRGGVSFTVPDGNGGEKHIQIDPNGRVEIDGEVVGRGEPIRIDARDAIPHGVVDIVQAVGFTLVLSIVGLPIARAVGRWIDRRGTSVAIPTEVVSRLSNIENAVETVAVEVERISEGQRFTTKLLNDRTASLHQ